MRHKLYEACDVPSVVRRFALELIHESGLNLPTHPVFVFIGKRSKVTVSRTKPVVFDSRTVHPAFVKPTMTIVELDLKWLIKESQDMVPFNKIPLWINDSGLTSIMRDVLVKRLGLGE